MLVQHTQKSRSQKKRKLRGQPSQSSGLFPLQPTRQVETQQWDCEEGRMFWCFLEKRGVIIISQQPVFPLQCSVVERNVHLPLKSLGKGVGQWMLMGAALWVNNAQYWAITDMGVLPGWIPLGGT